MGVTLVNRWVWHFGEMHYVGWNVKLCFSNNHNKIMFVVDRGFSLKPSLTAASHLYMLRIVSFVAFVHTSYSVNLLRQTLYVAFHFSL
jgi:hypothetical protein